MGYLFGQPPSTFAGACSALLAFTFQTISLVAVGWVVKVQGGWKITEGLWKVCNETQDTGDNSWCGDFPSVEEWLEATRAFAVVAEVNLCLCMVSTVSIYLLTDARIFGLVAPILSAIACFFLLLEFAFYADNVKKSSTQEHQYCFYLSIVAWILSFIAAVLLIDGRRRRAATEYHLVK